MGVDAKNHLAGLGVDVEYIEQLPGESTGMYLSILNDKNDMELAICNMDIFKRMTPAFLEERLAYLSQAEIVGVDCNLEAEALDYITRTLDVPLFLEPVSASKAERVKDMIGRFHTIKPNLIEAEMLSGIKIDSDEALHEAGQWFFDQGVKRVFISLSERGAYYKDKFGEGIVAPKVTDLVSATGAGDAFSAAILYGHVKGMNAREITEMGMICSSIAVQTKTAVNPEMSMEKVKERMK